MTEKNKQHLEHVKTLEAEFDSIISSLNEQGVVVEQKITDTRQFKYLIKNSDSIKEKLESLGAILQNSGPISQTDYYFLYPNETPGPESNTLCWREKKRISDYANHIISETPEVCELVVKNGSPGNDPHPSRLVKRALISDENTQYQVLEKIHDIRRGNDFAPFTVDKIKTTYSLPVGNNESVIFDIDEHVEITDKTNVQPYRYVGNFLKIKVPKTMPRALESLKIMLNITGDSFDVPYIARDALTQTIDKIKPTLLEEPKTETEWSGFKHVPCFYNPDNNTFITGIDPSKLKGFDKNEIDLIRAQIVQICADFDTSDGGEHLTSRKAGNGGGSTMYEKFTKNDGFINQPFIADHFTSATLWRKRWQPSDRRIVFSRVTFNDSPEHSGIFIHYIGSHDGYERWLERH